MIKKEVRIPLEIPLEINGTTYESVVMKCPTLGIQLSFQKMVNRFKNQGEEVAGLEGMKELFLKTITEPMVSPEDINQISLPDFANISQVMQDENFFGTSESGAKA